MTLPLRAASIAALLCTSTTPSFAFTKERVDTTVKSLTQAGIQVKWNATLQAYGEYAPATRTITVNSNLSFANQYATLIHEMAHADQVLNDGPLNFFVNDGLATEGEYAGSFGASEINAFYSTVGNALNSSAAGINLASDLAFYNGMYARADNAVTAANNALGNLQVSNYLAWAGTATYGDLTATLTGGAGFTALTVNQAGTSFSIVLAETRGLSTVEERQQVVDRFTAKMQDAAIELSAYESDAPAPETDASAAPEPTSAPTTGSGYYRDLSWERYCRSTSAYADPDCGTGSFVNNYLASFSMGWFGTSFWGHAASPTGGSYDFRVR